MVALASLACVCAQACGNDTGKAAIPATDTAADLGNAPDINAGADSDTATDSTAAAPTGPACKADIDCAQLITLGKWRKNEPLPACAVAFCDATAHQCDTKLNPAGSDCDDGDGSACTIGTCNAAGQCAPAAKVAAGACWIDGKCRAKGDRAASTPDANPGLYFCFSCQPEVLQTGWSANAAGTPCGSDDIACTTDACNGPEGKCSHAVQAGSCLIDAKTCVAAGAANPKNPCEICDPAAAADKWSPASAATACEGDSLACTEQTCDGKGQCGGAKVKAGFCLVGGACHSSGKPIDPSKPCAICDASASSVAATTLANGTACAAGAPCLLGVCQVGSCIAKGPKPKTCFIAADNACADENAFAPASPCLTCQPDVSQVAWTPLPQNTTCTADNTACTADGCDGKGACAHVPMDANCADKASACTLGVCDPKLDCLTVPKDATATCAGPDGVACTVETCDGKGGCNPVGKGTNSLCDDGFACTFDSCQPTGCVHGPMNDKCSDGNECTSDKCDVQKGCVNDNMTDGTPCSDDGLACTDNQCESGACQALPAPKSCIIDNKCVAAFATIDGGCKFCVPGKESNSVGGTYKWTKVGPGAACLPAGDDGVPCTKETCDANAVCVHTPDVSLCTDGLPCQVNECDAAKGCLYTDNCPWGHSCDSTDKVCLTTGKLPLELVKTDADNPNPTNPEAALHDLDGGGQMAWVVWQSNAAMVPSNPWTSPSWAGPRLRSMGLAPQKAAPDKKVKPQVVTLPVSSFFAGTANVTQAYPVVARDPQQSKQVWLGWLESGDGGGFGSASYCYALGGYGGVWRVARLDEATLTGKVETAGAICSYTKDNPMPMFLTPGFVPLDSGPADIGDIAKRSFLTARPLGSGYSWGNYYLLTGGPANDPKLATVVNTGAQLGKFRPVLVDLGTKAKPEERYLAIGVNELSEGAKVWASYVKADGTAGAPATWVDQISMKFKFEPTYDQVCSLDAAVTDGGDLGIALILRDSIAGDKRVVLFKRTASGGVLNDSQKVSSGTLSCNTGYAAVRLGAHGSGFLLSTFDTNNGTQGTAGIAAKMQLDGASFYLADAAAGTTDASKGISPSFGLAWRGLAKPVVMANGAIQFLTEHYESQTSLRSIRLYVGKAKKPF